MSDYDFTSLNATDFEKLVCALLNANEGNGKLVFTTFKPGRDQGIDAIKSTKDTKVEAVVQAKHYAGSTFSKLKSDLRNEYPKVELMKPSRYIVATSQGLTPQNKDSIKDIFFPYILSNADILGRDDLNNLLTLFPEIEQANYKLWFSGVSVLKGLVSAKYYGRRGEFVPDEIKRKLRLFVNIREIEYADTLLSQNKFVVITGEPGVGKSTLSEILIYRYLANGFNLTVIYNDILEVEDTISEDESPQIFYYDDFLGHTQKEIANCKTAENSLLKIITRISKLKNKFLILNTRRLILNSALEESERLRNFNLLRGESKVELNTYSLGAKMKMLENHLLESDMKSSKIDLIRSLKSYICNHNSFTPRHLEFFTSELHTGDLNLDQLKDFVHENLEYPRRIWEHAYDNQIEDRERFFLNTMYSFGGNTENTTIKEAFSRRISYEVRYNNHIRTQNPFKEAMQRLSGGFIVTDYYYDHKFYFINPSLEDFLKYNISDNPDEIERILFSSIKIGQWYKFFDPYFQERKLPKALLDYFKSAFINDSLENDKDRFFAAIFLASHSNENTKEVINLIRSISDWDCVFQDTVIGEYAFRFLKKVKSYKTLNYLFLKTDFSLYYNMILSCQFIEELIELLYLLANHYGFLLAYEIDSVGPHFRCNKARIKEIIAHCTVLFSSEVNDQYDYLTNTIDKEGYHDVFEKIDAHYEFIHDYISSNFKFDYLNLKAPNWAEIADQNHADYLTIPQLDFDPYEEEDKLFGHDVYLEDYDYSEYDSSVDEKDIPDLPF